MAANFASNDLLHDFQQKGITPDYLDHLAKMYRSVSNRPAPSAHKSSKRKSRSSHEPRSSKHTRMQASSEMDRHLAVSAQSAPAVVASSRNSVFHDTKDPLTLTSYQDHSLDPFSALNIDSSRRVQTRAANTHVVDGVFKDPSDFISNNIDHNTASPMLPNYTTLQIPDHRYCSQDSEQYSATSSHFAISPTAVSSIDSPSLSFDWATDMSREPTRNSLSGGVNCDPSLLDHMSMLRMASMTSNMSSSYSQQPHTSYTQYPQHTQQQFLQPHYDQSPPLPYRSMSHQSSIDDSTTSTSAPVDFEFYLAAPGLHHSESSQSHASSHSSSHVSHSLRRHQETVQHSQRSLASADNQPSSCSHHPLSHIDQQCQSVQMKKVLSQDGEEKVKIAKAERKYVRPSLPKLMCPHCNDHPEGFRGDHELQRHTSHFHAKLRKVWVCVDSSKDKTFLANCKACRTQKKYGAYYNAAAHLRRAHFNPRKRGRKAKNEVHEKRGGKGGGNWPPMENLKTHWMQEVEEEVKDADVVDDGSEDPDLTEEADIGDKASDMHHFADDLSFTGATFEMTTSQLPQASFPTTDDSGNELMMATMLPFDDDVYRLMPQAAGMMYPNPANLYFPEPALMPGEIWASS